MAFVTCLVLLVAVPYSSALAQHQSFAYNTRGSAGGPLETSAVSAGLASTALHLPAAFTPDGDGVNDTFSVDADGITSCNIVIYDRWGVPVFHSSSADRGWNGEVGNQKAPAGVYFYELMVHSTVLGQVYKAGTITLAYRY